MQCQQLPFFVSGPPHCKQFYPLPQTPSPQECPLIPQPNVIGEGEVTSVVLSDGTVQLFFLPLNGWTPLSGIGPWLVRQSPNTPWPFSAFPLYQTLQNNVVANALAGPLPIEGNYQLKFHNDRCTSTADLLYFYPQLRIKAVVSTSSRSAQTSEADDVSVTSKEGKKEESDDLSDDDISMTSEYLGSDSCCDSDCGCCACSSGTCKSGKTLVFPLPRTAKQILAAKRKEIQERERQRQKIEKQCQKRQKEYQKGEKRLQKMLLEAERLYRRRLAKLQLEEEKLRLGAGKNLMMLRENCTSSPPCGANPRPYNNAQFPMTPGCLETKLCEVPPLMMCEEPPELPPGCSCSCLDCDCASTGSSCVAVPPRRPPACRPPPPACRPAPRPPPPPCRPAPRPPPSQCRRPSAPMQLMRADQIQTDIEQLNHNHEQLRKQAEALWKKYETSFPGNELESSSCENLTMTNMSSPWNDDFEGDGVDCSEQ